MKKDVPTRGEMQMCDVSHRFSMIAGCLTNLESVLHHMGRQVTKGFRVSVHVDDRSALQCGAHLCRSLVAADPSAEVPMLELLRKHGIVPDKPMLRELAEACDRPDGRDLSGIAVHPKLATWCSHLRELTDPLREPAAREIAAQLAALAAEPPGAVLSA